MSPPLQYANDPLCHMSDRVNRWRRHRGNAPDDPLCNMSDSSRQQGELQELF
jgi:hypothetical protein